MIMIINRNFSTSNLQIAKMSYPMPALIFSSRTIPKKLAALLTIVSAEWVIWNETAIT